LAPVRELAALRRRKLWTQTDLAQRVGVSLKTVQAWENGHAQPRLRHVGRLAEVLDLPADELLNALDAKTAATLSLEADAATLTPHPGVTRVRGNVLLPGPIGRNLTEDEWLTLATEWDSSPKAELVHLWSEGNSGEPPTWSTTEFCLLPLRTGQPSIRRSAGYGRASRLWEHANDYRLEAFGIETTWPAQTGSRPPPWPYLQIRNEQRPPIIVQLWSSFVTREGSTVYAWMRWNDGETQETWGVTGLNNPANDADWSTGRKALELLQFTQSGSLTPSRVRGEEKD
jgi:transcriptional regulator with XRE-family HTH domain